MSKKPPITILQELSNVPAPSGDEGAMRRALRPLLTDAVDELHVDSMGNLIAHKRGLAQGEGSTPLRVMVSAHMDEVGLMVVGHAGAGYLQVEAVGGIDARLLPGLYVRVGREHYPGVIGLKPVHRVKDRTTAAPLSELCVDIGAEDEWTASRLAPVGTYITFDTQAHPVGELFAGKALDDRAGCTVLTTLLQGKAFPVDLYGAFTAQEEVGVRGAQTAAYAIRPDAAFVLEGTIADDLPHKEGPTPTSQLGKGPVITVMDRTYITLPRLLRFVTATAEALEIPYQLKRPGAGSSEAGAIQQSGAGVPTITLSLSCRYIHGPISLLDPRDLDATIALMHAILEHLTPDILKSA